MRTPKMEEAYFGGLDDARKVMISLADLHEKGSAEAVAVQLGVIRVIETLQREIAFSPLNQARARETLRLFRLFARNHENNPEAALEAIRDAINRIPVTLEPD